MAGNPTLTALDGGDPRLGSIGGAVGEHSHSLPRKTHDPSVSFEEYLYWAKITREEEKQLPDAHQPIRNVLNLVKKKPEVDSGHHSPPPTSVTSEKDEKSLVRHDSPPRYRGVSNDEWHQASRSFRTATWGAIFYLITTDVLGPYSVPWAFAQMGYGPGVALYTVFGALAGYTGWQLWHLFLMLDSTRYPMKTYGDFAFRIYGTVARHLMNILQTIQLIFNVGIIVISNGQGVYQINSNICYIACCIIWVALGMILGQIRTLQKFGWVANLAIWLNIVVLITTMAVVTHTPPNYAMSEDTNQIPKGDGIVHTYGGSPPYAKGFSTAVTGL
jgi:hypothetical protein